MRCAAPTPYTIRHDESLTVAHALMRAHDMRHFPVLEAGFLAGLVSQRDLYSIGSLRDVDPDVAPVSDAMSTDVFCVGPRTSIRKIAGEMAQHKYGAAVVMDGDAIVGIFTTTDALSVLCDLLAASGDAAALATHDERWNRACAESLPRARTRSPCVGTRGTKVE
ncbi:MAG: hypothetical protein RL701_7356 [Pseudomonadota bacterium]